VDLCGLGELGQGVAALNRGSISPAPTLRSAKRKGAGAGVEKYGPTPFARPRAAKWRLLAWPAADTLVAKPAAAT
jgi:hypothetical protein